MKKIFVVSVVLSLLFSQQVFASFNPGEGKMFFDVKDPYPYAYQIDWLGDNGVIRGYDDGTFKPEKCVNRAEFLKMLYAARESDVSQPSQDLSPIYVFSDVDLKAWYWPYLRFAIQKGVVQGYADKTFRPEQCVKRVEAVKMAVLEFNDGKVPTYGAMNDNLIDVASDAWYSPMMQYAHDAGVLGMAHTKVIEKGIEGNGVKYFPDQGMTRGEVAYLLYMSKALKDNGIIANDSSLWANNKKEVSYNEERGVLMPKQLKDAYAFDGCGKIDQYASEAWYPDFLKTLDGPGAKDPILPRITDACFSQEAGKLIILVDEGYMKLSSIYKYTVNKSAGALEHANFPGNPAYAIVNIPQFGKRQGDFIPLTGEVGDAGSGTQCHFEYYFEKNLLALQRCRTFSIDATVGGSGKPVYEPWKIIK